MDNRPKCSKPRYNKRENKKEKQEDVLENKERQWETLIQI